MNVKEIQDLIKFVAKVGVSEVEIEQKDFKITIRTNQENQQPVVMATAPMALPNPAVAQPLVQPSAPQTPTVVEKTTENDKYVTIKSPMIGTFYRSSGPDKSPFVAVGQSVSKGETLCIIEAMKLFNEIEAEISGKIIKVLVDDATPVEYDQPLFLIDPS